jgi:hypothetical protein
MYLVFICKQFISEAKIDEAVSAISWAHKLTGHSDPCHSSLVIQVREGVLRECRKPIMKKGPILPHYLLLLVEKYGNKNSCLSDLRIITICLLGYSGFLRFSEIVNIKRSDISTQFMINTFPYLSQEVKWISITKALMFILPRRF